MSFKCNFNHIDMSYVNIKKLDKFVLRNKYVSKVSVCKNYSSIADKDRLKLLINFRANC